MSQPYSAPIDYYAMLHLHPSASELEIRHSYRQLSKEYHPDTTLLPTGVAKVKFQELNHAYAILSNPARRLLYDQQINYSRIRVIQAPVYTQSNGKWESKHAYLDAIERPLSPGEIFMLLLLGGSFIACIGLVLVVAASRGELG